MIPIFSDRGGPPLEHDSSIINLVTSDKVKDAESFMEGISENGNLKEFPKENNT